MVENLKIREFEIAIKNYVEKSNLPVEIKRLALSEIVKQLSEQADMQVRQEVLERDIKEKEESEDAESI